MAENKDWLRKSLQDKFSAEKAPVRDDLWDNIEPRIRKKKKRRGLIWIWFLSGLLGLATAGLLIWKDIVNKDNQLSKSELVRTKKETTSAKEEKTTTAIIKAKNASKTDSNANSLIDINEEKTAELNNDLAKKNKAGNLISETKNAVSIPQSSVFNESDENSLNLNLDLKSINSKPTDLKSIDSNLNESNIVDATAPNALPKVDVENTGSGNPPLIDNRLKWTGIGLLDFRLDFPKSFPWNFPFPLQPMPYDEKVQVPLEKGSWYGGISLALHRQLITPNTNDNFLLLSLNDDSELSKLQWGAALEFGRKMAINKNLNWFGAITLGWNSFSLAFNSEFLDFEFVSASKIDNNAIRLAVAKEMVTEGRSANFISPGLNVGLNYQPLVKFPIYFTAGGFAKYNLVSKDFISNHLEYGLLGGIGWEIGKKKELNVNLRTEFGLNNADWLLYESRKQTVKLLFNYKF